MPRISTQYDKLAFAMLFDHADDFFARELTQQQAADELTALLKKKYPHLNIIITKSIIGRLWTPGGDLDRPPWNKGAGTKNKARDTRSDLDVLVQITSCLIERLGGVQFPEPLRSQFETLEAETEAREVAKRVRAAEAETDSAEVVGEPVPAAPSPIRSEFGHPPAAAQ